MPVPLVAAAGVAGKVIGTIGGLFGSGSPRYAGGPLMSTVQQHSAEIAAGDLFRIRDWDSNRKAGKPGWQEVWRNELPTIPLNQAQIALVRSLDPSLPIRGGGTEQSAVPPPGAATPPGAPPTLLAGGFGSLAIVGLVVVLAVVLFRGRG